jgi:hypothetical protein
VPTRFVPGSNLEYLLIVFDENGQERRELDGSLLSERVLERTKG